jgi:hypothetical protein
MMHDERRRRANRVATENTENEEYITDEISGHRRARA